MTDTQKTLLALMDAGSHGVHSFELNRLVGTIRAAARISDLKKLGYVIDSIPETLGNARGVRYVLHEKIDTVKHVEKQKPHYVFDQVKQVFVEAVQNPIQEIKQATLMPNYTQGALL